jgi:hypothetical protein
MTKEEFKKLLSEVLRDYYEIYRTVGSDTGFRNFYQYITGQVYK